MSNLYKKYPILKNKKYPARLLEGILMEEKRFKDEIKNTFMALAAMAKAYSCNVNLYHLIESLNMMGIELTNDEVEVFL